MHQYDGSCDFGTNHLSSRVLVTGQRRRARPTAHAERRVRIMPLEFEINASFLRACQEDDQVENLFGDVIHHVAGQASTGVCWQAC